MDTLHLTPLKKNASYITNQTRLQRNLVELVFTPQASGYNTNTDCIFTGPWCFHDPYNGTKNTPTDRIVNWHWANRDKFQNDQPYLESLYEGKLDQLTLQLNKIHNLDKKRDFWRIIIGPWLLTFLTVCWDRHQIISTATSIHSDKQFFIRSDSEPSFYDVPLDFDNFQEHIKNIHWNGRLFTSIAKDCFAIHTEAFQSSKSSKILSNQIPVNLKAIKKVFKDLLIPIVQMLSRNNQVVMTSSYFDRFSYLSLCWKLRQWPSNGVFENQSNILSQKLKNETFQPDSSRMKPHSLVALPQLSFENWLDNNLLSYIPKAYLEHFNSFIKVASELFPRASVVMTANAHVSDDIFKIWCAYRRADIKFIVSEHGGSRTTSNGDFNHEEKISDINIVASTANWLHYPKISNPKFIRLISTKSTKTKPNCRYPFALVGFNNPLYSYRPASAPVGALMVEEIDDKIRFLKHLDPKVRKRFKARPQGGSAWPIRKLWAEILGAEAISSGTNTTFRSLLKNSELVVTSYPQTTFAESLWSNTPTVLLVHRSWKLGKSESELIPLMIDAKIWFVDPIMAADHINNISKDPLVWWNEALVVSAKNLWLKNCNYASKNWLKEWYDVLRIENP
jgi:putative transferase (TIGR04331 family)